MTIKNLNEYKVTHELNQFAFLIYHFPLFKQVPLKTLVNSKIKRFLVKISFPVSIIMSVFTKLLYLFIISLLAYSTSERFSSISNKTFLFIFIVGLNVLKRYSILFLNSPERWALTKQFHVKAKDYYNAESSLYLLDRVTYALILFLAFFKSSSLSSLVLSLSPIFMSLQIETFIALYFMKHHKKPSISFHFLSFFISLFIATLTLFTLITNQGLFIILVVQIILIIAMFYFLNNINIIDDVQYYMITTMDISQKPDDAISEATLKNLRVDDEVILEKGEFEHQNYEGYTLLNKLFFKRHRRLWQKPLKHTSYIFLTLCALLLIVRLFITFFDPTFITESAALNIDLSKLSAPLLFVLFIANRTEVLTKSMYLNCDYAFLHFPFYKQRSFIWKQYLIRFKTCIMINVVQPLAFLILIYFGSLLGFFTLQTPTFFHLASNLIIGSFIITALYLSLYYIFQPFTKDMSVKNGFYTFFTSIASFFFIYNRNALTFVTSIIWALPLILIVVLITSLLGVSILAPKNFRYKD